LEKDNSHNSILRTKLHRPPVPADYVHRSRMLSPLERGGNRPVTLVSAPAGYGKNTLVSSWLEVCERPGVHGNGKEPGAINPDKGFFLEFQF
jgi:LuxR family maltose regulon positive regulatory protein